MKSVPKPAPPVAEVAGVHLTQREMDVLKCLVGGHDTNKAAARSLNLAPCTVNDHLRAIFPKLGVRSRVAAAVWAVRNGAA